MLCEDDISEAIVLGTVDALSRAMNFSSDQISIGRNTGKDEFPNHVRALDKVGSLSDFIFVMDGDARDMQDRIEQAADGRAKVLFYPVAPARSNGFGRKSNRGIETTRNYCQGIG